MSCYNCKSIISIDDNIRKEIKEEMNMNELVCQLCIVDSTDGMMFFCSVCHTYGYTGRDEFKCRGCDYYVCLCCFDLYSHSDSDSESDDDTVICKQCSK